MDKPKETKTDKIMTTPLPEILNEVEAAAADARRAADEARQAGLDASEDVKKAVAVELRRIEAIAEEGKMLALTIAAALHNASSDIHTKTDMMEQ